ncbi:MAG: amidohydrolase family protein [Bacteroidetes bacterium]|jgi:predicted TIM-barrel fold metal-dependent hydrolase|nr:amidohydrolase family protein [Bacteroidota bacterium]
MMDKKYLRILNKLVQQRALEIVDVHVHPFDVVETSDFNHYHKLNELLYQHKQVKGEKYNLNIFRNTRLMDRLKLNRYANEMMRFFDGKNWFGLSDKGCSDSYLYIGIKRLVDEMKMANIKKDVLLSVEPFNKLKDIYKYYKHARQFYYLASVDVHQMNKYEIEMYLAWQMDNYPIVGIKLHPNLQGFYPFPNDNNDLVAEKLHKVYEFAANNGLYVMLHSGLSEIPMIDQKLKEFPVYHELADDKFGLLSSYVDENGNAPLFEKYENTFIIAHLFYSGSKYTDVDQISSILQKYPHVYADTSNVPANILSAVIQKAGPSKIMFGSNALYNKQLVELLVTLKSIEYSAPATKFDEYCVAVLGNNFNSVIAQKSKQESMYA